MPVSYFFTFLFFVCVFFAFLTLNFCENTHTIKKPKGITTILNSRASVLAAANPTFGRYDDSRATSENVDMESTILSRFDLIFIIRDVMFKKLFNFFCFYFYFAILVLRFHFFLAYEIYKMPDKNTHTHTGKRRSKRQRIGPTYHGFTH